MADAEQTADRLHSAAIHLLRRLRREDAKTGLSAPRLSALSVVVFGGPLTLGELASAEQVKPPTMTRLVSALEDEGLVTREPDASDGRLTRIRATAKGRTLLMRGRANRVAALTAEVRALPGADRDVVERAVTILEAVIGRLQ
ncbi:MAG TPA: MarR family transcriptional regulator [Gemmatimonadaceae bacterium]|nr:MarR family transcriptional regulator [Gemmatimonadaceae bacterium]